MVREYDHELYDPAHLAFSAQMQSRFDSARRSVKWSGKVREVWDRVHFVETGPAPAGPVTSGITVPVRATVDLAGLDPEDVRVELVMGRVGASGSLEETEVMVLPAVESERHDRHFRQGDRRRSRPGGWAMRCASAPTIMMIR